MSAETAVQLQIRPAGRGDLPDIARIFRAVVARGDSFAFPEGMSDAEIQALWMGLGCYAFVATANGAVLGSYSFHANQPGRGAHVANAAYIVDPAIRGRGVGRRMGEHSLVAARQAGFEAMQFNLVVSTNAPAVRLWQSLGFAILATLPRAFDHATLGRVDAYLMHRFL